jgi:Ca2+-transporting ATPase
MVVILIIAAGVSIILGDIKDAVAILAIVVLNALLGFTQEYRAEKAIAALKKLAVPTVKVRRDGHLVEKSARELVVGDVVLLEAGNLVPADGRILESVNLRVQEATLTGESEPIEKETRTFIGENLPLGDRRNMVYMGTVITYGRGQAVITATGMQTELGHIATMLQTVESEPTPLQKRLDKLGHTLAIVALAIVAVVFVLGLWRGEDWRVMLLTAVSMAVAAVPEGLPAVVTIALALGAQRMLQRRALIRKLPAVETLGSVTVICSDKTGTLTENRMTVTVLDVANQRVDVIATLREDKPIGQWQAGSAAMSQTQTALRLMLIGGALCNDATLELDDKKPGSFHVVGDPTEGALVVAAARYGMDKTALEQAYPRVAEVPFDAERKRMTTVHQLPQPQSQQTNLEFGIGELGISDYLAFTKGAVDKLLEVTTYVWMNGRREPLSDELRARIVEANNQLARQGMRVLGVAFRPLDAPPQNSARHQVERELTFIGLIGMIDPARPEVKAAVQTCQTAGIKPIMITGDHPLTAQTIARDLNIAAADLPLGGSRILTGQDLSQLSTAELENVVENVSVYARVAPEHKLKIVQALQKRGHIVAMTGDGVNDAPALKQADIGVAMGLVGTDVAKEAADMVLLDDNFATIVAAVEQGRVIYDNIRKFIKYLMTTNSGELWVMLLAPFLGMPLPLLPLQILWMNLVTDGLPALALGVEPAERNVMRHPPYRPHENILGRGMGWHIVWVGFLMGMLVLGSGYLYWRAGDTHWQTLAFTTLTLAQMAHVLAIRSDYDSLFRIGLLSNKLLLGAVAVTFLLQLAIIYAPIMQAIFQTHALPFSDLLISLLLSSLVFVAVEVEKWRRRRKNL